jgi:hypothetical protein
MVFASKVVAFFQESDDILRMSHQPPRRRNHRRHWGPVVSWDSAMDITVLNVTCYIPHRPPTGRVRVIAIRVQDDDVILVSMDLQRHGTSRDLPDVVSTGNAMVDIECRLLYFPMVCLDIAHNLIWFIIIILVY